jgi:creatinine amidohydrolase
MKKVIESLILLSTALSIFATGAVAAEQPNAPAGTLPVKYEELTAVEFISAVDKSAATCLIPFGVLEKHGPHLPLGTDLIDVREVAMRAAGTEYAIVFPQYYFGQIFEGKHQPGTIAYSQRIIWDLLQETCDELSRNGIKKIIIVNGHGGNTHFLKFFAQAQLAERRDYAVYVIGPGGDPKLKEKVKELKKTKTDGHAGEIETSFMMAHRPDLVKLDKANDQSGKDQKRIKDLDNAYTAIWWYASFPNHYAGDGSAGTAELGTVLVESSAEGLVKLIRQVKKDTTVRTLQKKFFDEAERPLETRQ